MFTHSLTRRHLHSFHQTATHMLIHTHIRFHNITNSHSQTLQQQRARSFSFALLPVASTPLAAQLAYKGTNIIIYYYIIKRFRRLE